MSGAGAGADDGGRRLSEQIEFLCALDELKRVQRQTTLLDGSRRENSAEHSWHLALYAIVLAEYGGGVNSSCSFGTNLEAKSPRMKLPQVLTIS